MSTPAPATSPRQAWLDAYEHRTSPWLSGLALVFLVTFSIQIIWPDRGEPWFIALSWFGSALWLLFAIDLAVRLSVAERKLHFLRHNLLDTITVAIPQLRALRALRIFTKGGILSKGKGVVSGGAVTTALLGTLLIVWIGSLSILSAERTAPHAEITTLQDAIWWAFETITTVGYGDFVPVTEQGRAIAVSVMFFGISVLSAVTAGISATLVKQVGPTSQPNDEVLAELQDLKAMVAALQRQLGAGAPATSGNDRPTPG